MVPQNGMPMASQGANAWGGAAAGEITKEGRNQWKKAVVKESTWSESSWGVEEWSAGSVDVQASAC